MATPLVSICSVTYNHAPYIRQCLDGLVMQKTNFPYEILIHDDCSTDGTTEIVKEYAQRYPDKIVPLLENENQYWKVPSILFRLLFPKVRGKYIAFNDGDDYWTDENKLQMQIDFLEKYPEYGMCYTTAKKFIQTKNKFTHDPAGELFIDFVDLLKRGNNIPILTCVTRTDLVQKYLNEINPTSKNWLADDYPLLLWLSKNSQIYFFDRIAAVYRILEKSASHDTNPDNTFLFDKSMYEIREFYSNLSGIKIEDFNEIGLKRDLYLKQLVRKYDKNLAEKLVALIVKNEATSIKRNVKTFILKNRILFFFYVHLKGCTTVY